MRNLWHSSWPKKPIISHIITAIKFIAYILTPNRCYGCSEIIGIDGMFCTSCWLEMQFINNHCCNSCGIVAPTHAPNSWLCARCVGHKSIVTRSAFVYNAMAARIIARFKFHGYSQAAKDLSHFLIIASKSLIQEVDIVVPVPMHILSLLQRSYNQSALLAIYLAKHYQLICDCELLIKRRMTKQQRRLSQHARQLNIKNAFRVSKNIRGKVILLVDDVITTGTTIRECAKTLKKHGAKDVRVVSLARTIKLG